LSAPDEPPHGGVGRGARENVPFVDTDVLIRFLTGDDPKKQKAAAALLKRAERGEVTLRTLDTAIADAVFVLTSPRLYRVAREDVRDMLSALVRLPGLDVDNRSIVLRALDLFAEYGVDFGDAMIVASMRDSGSSELFSYDGDFDRIEGVRRREPRAE
jgi:uncharacterized protein